MIFLHILAAIVAVFSGIVVWITWRMRARAAAYLRREHGIRDSVPLPPLGWLVIWCWRIVFVGAIATLFLA